MGSGKELPKVQIEHISRPFREIAWKLGRYQFVRLRCPDILDVPWQSLVEKRVEEGCTNSSRCYISNWSTAPQPSSGSVNTRNFCSCFWKLCPRSRCW